MLLHCFALQLTEGSTLLTTFTVSRTSGHKQPVEFYSEDGNCSIFRMSDNFQRSARLITVEN
jgi:hypothetical protein